MLASNEKLIYTKALQDIVKSKRIPACQVELYLQHDFSYINEKLRTRMNSQASSDRAGTTVRFKVYIRVYIYF